jgi:hypothetical protein
MGIGCANVAGDDNAFRTFGDEDEWHAERATLEGQGYRAEPSNRRNDVTGPVEAQISNSGQRRRELRPVNELELRRLAERSNRAKSEGERAKKPVRHPIPTTGPS